MVDMAKGHLRPCAPAKLCTGEAGGLRGALSLPMVPGQNPSGGSGGSPEKF